jgi:hypothetical protein
MMPASYRNHILVAGEEYNINKQGVERLQHDIYFEFDLASNQSNTL